jgi:transposase
MKTKTRKGCPKCRSLQAKLDAQQAQLAALEVTVARLQEQLAAARKDSATSSKPPSSDIVKPPQPPPPEGQNRRSIGGQPGHPKHQRVAFPPEAVNAGTSEYRLDLCPGCGHHLEPDHPNLPRVIQQVDITRPPRSIPEHCGHSGWCPCCQKVYEARLPIGIRRGGWVGPSLTTEIADLKGVCHASFSTICKYVREVIGLTISPGQLAAIIAKVSQALERPYQQLRESLPGEFWLTIDETGHKQNGQRQWTWCFRAELDTMFKLDPTRSGDVLIEVLGKEFNGVLGCDYFSAYRRYQREFGVSLPFCLAHLIRDVKFLTTLPDERDPIYGTRLRESLRQLFGVIHRRENWWAQEFQRHLEVARAEVLRCGLSDVPDTKPSRNLAKRFQKHGESYFRFITTPGVDPTNNLAEPAIRFVVIDRLITPGTRSETGNRWCERIWTVIATCTQQGRSVFEYLEAVVTAWFADSEPPRLLPGV